MLRAAIESHGGHVVKMTGDGAHGVFASAHDAIAAAVEAQRSLVVGTWDETGPVAGANGGTRWSRGAAGG